MSFSTISRELHSNRSGLFDRRCRSGVNPTSTRAANDLVVQTQQVLPRELKKVRLSLERTQSMAFATIYKVMLASLQIIIAAFTKLRNGEILCGVVWTVFAAMMLINYETHYLSRPFSVYC
jgi:hypothetical protein